MSCWCPIFVKLRWSQVNAFIFFSHRLFVLFLTFCAYVCYHASRKPISVVKNELCHCSAINGSSNCTSWICKSLLFILLLLCVRLKLLFFVFTLKLYAQVLQTRPLAYLHHWSLELYQSPIENSVISFQKRSSWTLLHWIAEITAGLGKWEVRLSFNYVEAMFFTPTEQMHWWRTSHW